jgi:hypothetical protein
MTIIRIRIIIIGSSHRRRYSSNVRGEENDETFSCIV